MKFFGMLTIEAALAAVQNDGNALRYAPTESRTEAVALAAVQNNGYALQYVPTESCTEAVALAAVQNDGDALQYVLNLDLFLRIAAKCGIKVDL